MATFYLLPPRHVVSEHLGSFLGALFPGLDWSNQVIPELAETLSEAAHTHPDIYVVYQEDVAQDADPAATLLRDFGAERGDEIVEVRSTSGRLAEAGRWRLLGS